jgi:(2Fe-2S) ferredoxin
MRKVDARGCRVQVLVCTNDRTGKSDMPSCAPLGGTELFLRLKDRARAEGKLATHWITKTGCLGFCNPVGTTVVLHRPGQASEWYMEVTDADFDAIWEAVTRA